MVQRCRESPFALEATAKGGVVGERWSENLERHRAPDPRVACSVDDPHASAAGQAFHHVPSQPLAGS
jgi:hypothetical protein